MRIILLFLTLVLVPISMFSQVGEISGKVKDEKGEGIPFATIVILQNNVPTGKGTQTDFDGNYSLKPLTPGKYDVKFSYVGYTAQLRTGVVVSAKDLGTGKEQRMTITGGSALPKDEIDRMMKDAEAHAEEDKKRREEADIRNTGDSLVYQTEKFLKDNADKFNEGENATKKTELETALADLKKALAGSDITAIKSATEKVSEISQQLGAALYAANAAAQTQTTGGTTPDDGVQDAEIVEEK